MKISVLVPTIRVEGLRPNIDSLEKQTFKSFELLVEVGLVSKGHDLNAAFNRMLKRAKGELIVFMEDWTKCLPNGLEQFWNAYQNEKDVFWTAPLGKTDDWKENRWDWRAYTEGKDMGAIDGRWDCWEIDWACAPREALFKVGGFDEELDKYWSCDNVSVGYRAFLKGYRFKNLYTNPAVAWDHNKYTKHPFAENYNPQFNNERMEQVKIGNLKIDYLN